MWKITLTLQVILWPIVWLQMRLFGNLRIIGSENTKGHKVGAIFAVNHSSELDPFLVPATLDPFSALFPMHYVARTREFYEKTGITQYAYGGLVFEIFGAYPAMPGMKDYERMLLHHIKILCRGHSVCIFPEGKLNISGEVGRGAPGVAYLSWRTGRPIIPVAIHGCGQMGLRDFFARKCMLSVSYGEPVTWEDLFGEDTNRAKPTHDELIDATQVIMSRIKDMLVACNSSNQVILQGLQTNLD